MTHVIFYISYIHTHMFLQHRTLKLPDLRVRHEVDTALALQSRGMIRSQETFGDGQIRLSDVRCLFLQGYLGQPGEVFMYIYFFLVKM